jgi:hypothetical protein
VNTSTSSSQTGGVSSARRQLRTARIWIGESTSYRVGDQVQIAYNPAKPRDAVLARGHPDIGPIGFPLFVALIAGVTALVFGIRRLRLCRGARKALRGSSYVMGAETDMLPRGQVDRCAVLLANKSGKHASFWSAAKHGWCPLPQTEVDVAVFGNATPGSALVVVDLARQIVTAGRAWKPPGRFRRRLAERAMRKCTEDNALATASGADRASAVKLDPTSSEDFSEERL